MVEPLSNSRFAVITSATCDDPQRFDQILSLVEAQRYELDAWRADMLVVTMTSLAIRGRCAS
ncbi:MAG: hypothetical protein ACRDPK_19685 [Carbonactinosporaceae bacterium]